MTSTLDKSRTLTANLNAQGKRRLTCSCCGEDAGRWQQWHNRDTGYGICRRCVEWLTSEPRAQYRYDAEELRRCYGVEGTHYAHKAMP